MAMISKINLITGYEGWWVDTDASRHVCFDCAQFKNYSKADDKKVLLGDFHTTIIVGLGEDELKFSSKKNFLLKDVLHTPEMRKNLFSGYLLNNASFVRTIGINM